MTIGRQATYNRCINFAVADDGLHIQVFLPFRFGHPPLFIPWNRIVEVTPVNRFGFTVYRLEIDSNSGPVHISIPEKVLVASKNAIVNVLK